MAASGAYATALGDLRDTVKWIIAAFTGAGAIVFSGLTITNISGLAESGQWILPVALAAVPLVAAAVAIAAALHVINATPPPADSLFSEYAAFSGYSALTAAAQEPGGEISPALAKELPSAIGVYGTRAEFDTRLVEALKRVRYTDQRLKESPNDDGWRAAYETALTTLDGLQSTVKDALDCAAYVKARARFRSFALCVLIAAVVSLGALIASGVVTGGALSSQQAASTRAAKAAPPASVSFTQPTPVQVWLTARQPAKAGGKHDCPFWNGIPAIAVGGTPSEPVLLFPGYTSAAARDHGIPFPPAGCAAPWLWTTKAGEVLVVPR